MHASARLIGRAKETFKKILEENSLNCPSALLSVTDGAQTVNGIFQTSNKSTYISLPKTSARRIIPVKLFYRIFLSRADASR